jgi:hypothetical protein
VVAARACDRFTDTVTVALTVLTFAPVSMTCSRIDEPESAGERPSADTDCGELLLVTIVVVRPAQRCNVSFHANVQARIDTVPTDSPVTVRAYVAPTRSRLPLFVTEKYCGGGTAPPANEKLVADGVAIHVADVMV